MKTIKQIVLFILFAILFTSFKQSHAQNIEGWSEAQEIPGTYETRPGYPIIISDPYGQIHLFYAGQDGMVYHLLWNGISWTQPFDILVGGGIPSVVVDSAARIHLLYEQNGQLAYSWAPLIKANLAKSWSKPYIIPMYVVAYSMAIDSQNMVHIFFMVRDTGSQIAGVFYTHTPDAGVTWSQPTQLSSEPELLKAGTDRLAVQIAVDGADRVHLVWANKPTARLFYTRSLDTGNSWLEPIELNEGQTLPPEMLPNRQDPHLFTIGEDEIHLLWYARGQNGDTCARFHQWSQDGGVTWFPPMRVLGHLYNCVGRSGMALDGDGILHIVSSGRGNDDTGMTRYYHSYWTGSDWAPTNLVNSRGYECPSLSIAGGNKFVSIGCSNLGSDPGLYYMTWNSPARAIASIPITTSDITIEPAVTTAQASTETIQSTSPVQKTDLHLTNNPIKSVSGSSSSQFPIWVGVLPVLILVIVVALTRIRFKNN